MVEVPLSQGRVALIDEIDRAAVMSYKWTWQAVNRPTVEDAQGYAVRLMRIGSKRVKTYLHRFVAQRMINGQALEDGVVIDHANGNGLDNRRCNLRPSTSTLNNANRLYKNAASGFIGVYPANAKWAARISIGGVWTHIGVYPDKEEAAIMRDRKARELFGAFAILNFPEGEPF